MQFVRNLLTEQRRRAVGMLMGYVEAEVYPHLSTPVRRELRAQIIKAIDGYHVVVLDVLKSSINDGSVVNEEFVELIAGLRGAIVDLRTEMEEWDG